MNVFKALFRFLLHRQRQQRTTRRSTTSASRLLDSSEMARTNGMIFYKYSPSNIMCSIAVSDKVQIMARTGRRFSLGATAALNNAMEKLEGKAEHMDFKLELQDHEATNYKS